LGKGKEVGLDLKNILQSDDQKDKERNISSPIAKRSMLERFKSTRAKKK